MTLIIAGLLQSALVVGLLFFFLHQSKSKAGGGFGKLKEELDLRKGIRAEIEQLYSTMVDARSLREKGRQLIALRESLKTERGRSTITQAELETVESRLRELEEIERELEASAIDTKEELNILQKKQRDLAAKNDSLKTKISTTMTQMEGALAEMEVSAEVKEQIQALKGEILQTQEKVDSIVLQIEQGNDQYFVLKQRYDALDIEYAQLYEKFAASEGAQKSEGS